MVWNYKHNFNAVLPIGYINYANIIEKIYIHCTSFNIDLVKTLLSQDLDTFYPEIWNNYTAIISSRYEIWNVETDQTATIFIKEN